MKRKKSPIYAWLLCGIAHLMGDSSIAWANETVVAQAQGSPAPVETGCTKEQYREFLDQNKVLHGSEKLSEAIDVFKQNLVFCPALACKLVAELDSDLAQRLPMSARCHAIVEYAQICRSQLPTWMAPSVLQQVNGIEAKAAAYVRWEREEQERKEKADREQADKLRAVRHDQIGTGLIVAGALVLVGGGIFAAVSESKGVSAPGTCTSSDGVMGERCLLDLKGVWIPSLVIGAGVTTAGVILKLKK